MTYKSRKNTGASDAAQILRGYRKRIERLEESRGSDTDRVQLFRPVVETVFTNDQVSVTEDTANNFVFGQSEWGLAEFGDTQ